MNSLDENCSAHLSSNYFYPRSRSRSRPNLVTKETNETFLLEIDHRKFLHQTRECRISSPPMLFQPTSTPDLFSIADDASSISSLNSPFYSKPVRLSSKILTMPMKHDKEKVLSKDFPKQSFERRQMTQERKQQKQKQRRSSAESNSEHWFQLRQSLAELKRLAATEQILVDPTTSLFSCDGFSFETLKQVTHQQQKSRSGPPSSLSSVTPSFYRSKTSLSNLPPRPKTTTKPKSETFSRSLMEPLMVAAKPLHPLLLTGNHSSPSRMKTPLKASRSSIRGVTSTPPTSSSNDEILRQRREEILLSDFCQSPSPGLLTKSDEEKENRLGNVEDRSSSLNRPTSNYSRVTSSLSLRSTIKLNSQIPRCRSAFDVKPLSTLTKSEPKFIIITDQEHRIESWYHHFPFIPFDDLLQSFRSKKEKLTISAFFLEEISQEIPTNFKGKIHLQGKPFHVNSDWKKFDLIFISENIYQEIIFHLQSIVNFIRSAGKIIQIYRIDHQQDLKTQIRSICREFNQKISFH